MHKAVKKIKPQLFNLIKTYININKITRAIIYLTLSFKNYLCYIDNPNSFIAFFNSVKLTFIVKLTLPFFS